MTTDWDWHKHVIEVTAIVLGGIGDRSAARAVAVFFTWYAGACHRMRTRSVEALRADYVDCVPEPLVLDDLDFRRMLHRIGCGTPIELAPEFYQNALGKASFERRG